MCWTFDNCSIAHHFFILLVIFFLPLRLGPSYSLSCSLSLCHSPSLSLSLSFLREQSKGKWVLFFYSFRKRAFLPLDLDPLFFLTSRLLYLLACRLWKGSLKLLTTRTAYILPCLGHESLPPSLSSLSSLSSLTASLPFPHPHCMSEIVLFAHSHFRACAC
ncbi:hypothetical protein BKA57DRAFT_144696 [Linnemannia elongata]|nr:hypothetical protein BKA57DRAFT_144696 [Linnemannia elongata]